MREGRAVGAAFELFHKAISACEQGGHCPCYLNLSAVAMLHKKRETSMIANEMSFSAAIAASEEEQQWEQEFGGA